MADQSPVLHGLVKNFQKGDAETLQRIITYTLKEDYLINTPDEWTLYYAVYIGEYELSAFFLACGATFTQSEILSTSNDHIRALLKKWSGLLRTNPWPHEKMSLLRWMIDSGAVSWKDPNMFLNLWELAQTNVKQLATVGRFVMNSAVQRSRQSASVTPTSHLHRRPLSYYNQNEDDEDRKLRGLKPRWSSEEYFGRSLSEEAEQNSPDNIVGLIRTGKTTEKFVDPTNVGWTLAEFAYLKSWHQVLECIRTDPRASSFDRRSILLDLARLVSGNVDRSYFDLMFVAGKASTSEKFFHANWFVLKTFGQSLINEYKVQPPYNVDLDKIPTQIPERSGAAEYCVKEHPLVFGALLEWIYTFVLCEDTWVSLEKENLIPELRGAAFHFKFSELQAACGKRSKKQSPFFPKNEKRQFYKCLSPYVDEEGEFDQSQLRNCLSTAPDRILLVENRPIFIHSALLSARSDYFKALLSFHANRPAPVVLEGPSYEAAWHTVNYIYTTDANSSPSLHSLSPLGSIELRDWCCEVMLPGILEQCDSVLAASDIPADLVLDYLQAGLDSNRSELVQKCYRTLGLNLLEIASKHTVAFKEIMTPDRLAAVYQTMDPATASITKKNLSIFLLNN